MSDGRKLVAAMKQAGKTDMNKLADIVVGEVISVAPLQVKVDKLILTESFLVVGALCQQTIIAIPSHTHTLSEHTTEGTEVSTFGEHTHIIKELTSEFSMPTIPLWRGLIVGDKVHMIRYSQGNKYYILQREEGVI